jgi:hypothetical protein
MQSNFGKCLKVLLSASAISVFAGTGGTLALIQPALAQDTVSLVSAVQAAKGSSPAIQLAISSSVITGLNGSFGGAPAANGQSVAATVIALFSGPAAPYPGLVSAADLRAALAAAGAALGPAATSGIGAAMAATGDTLLASAYAANGGILTSNDGVATGVAPGGNPPALPSLLSSLNSGTRTTGLTTGGGSTSITPSPSSPF